MTEPRHPPSSAFQQANPAQSFAEQRGQYDPAQLIEARQVFLNGNGLPGRWHQRRVFTIIEASFHFDFGAVLRFLVTWAAWRADPARCERLHLVAAQIQPLNEADLRAALRVLAPDPDSALAHLAKTLADAWPVPVPGVHRLEFDHGQVTLTLLFSPRHHSRHAEIHPGTHALSTLVLRADALYLDLGFLTAPPAPAFFKTLTRFAGENATFAALCDADHAPALRSLLTQSGFACTESSPSQPTANSDQISAQTPRLVLTGHFAPRWQVRRHEPPMPLNPHERHAIVIGAGLAGCALIERLTARGWHITSLERHARVAQEASGNPAGVFHPMMSRDDNLAARLTRAGFLYALQRWTALSAMGYPPLRGPEGLLQIAASSDEAQAMADTVAALAYPTRYAQSVSSTEAQHLAGMPLAHGGWFYPHGGWIDPAALCAAQYAAAGARLERRFGIEVSRLSWLGDQWQVFDTSGQAVACAPVVIVANAHDAARIAGLRFAATQSVRGQLTLLPATAGLSRLRLPVIGTGYAVPLAGEVTLTGATYDIDDPDPTLRLAGHSENLERLSQMLPGIALNPSLQNLTGRVAFRCVTSDRLPMSGSLADETLALLHAQQLAGGHLADLPRASGLYGSFAFGSRGLVWAALSAELIAAQIEGEPLPLERELADALDPARFLLRALRHPLAS
ncbi:bifunctional tRNA (5-methylaminomethyl-2-thiouridine)(34)-methyltransferase MnmD/FAD-dependent 5-carboxymethylaminomethyl-2-thiouridine(34) oxidoreductase MnmC [Paraburkholderia bonniea]|uniref:bifunctional tRNA (5-methylaminomethyl-2-thiouridine)(34)-methyltransferase MnmD/FAD-dependent 5-carboxymethylaminomethyl-2-thiouridine(34) oxidoreductase MnmC n=1 Tax=Paraburkholderia bonniea TaxID=2152891 RepID=UPI001292317C|nr:bifunctional tRNA (5-methylaminomethyl-2-thiouridine)(34)-methyltransferase MnmD/FAD-dependent 5-carboxymethylaminomethyl-2-thiouridine(34) oxidoreductase MnmC [Paraburkholderia bonniea]